jgi:hypothetical protein
MGFRVFDLVKCSTLKRTTTNEQRTTIWFKIKKNLNLNHFSNQKANITFSCFAYPILDLVK